MSSIITVTDQFCGAGGSSQGIRQYAESINEKTGIEIRYALNHWERAIETHNKNFPDTYHDCTDISAVDPRRYAPTTILITSPECTNQGLANGKKRVKAQMDLFKTGHVDPSAERSRATMWDVPRFTEYHKYEIVIVENVVEARKWVMWDAWILAMQSLGYDYKCVYLNSMFALPTPQSRDRLYVVFWKKGNKAPDLEFYPRAYCSHCNKVIESVQTWKNPHFRWGKYRTQYTYNCPVCHKEVQPFYYAAFNIIDWSDIGQRIGDRKKPLKPKTKARILFGREKYKDSPLIITGRYTSGIECRVRSVVDNALPTQPADDSHYLYSPFIIKGEHTQDTNVRSANEALQTQTTRQTMSLCVPFIAELKGTSKARGIYDPLGCVTGTQYHALIGNSNLQSFLSYHYKTSQASAIFEAVRTLTTKERASLVSYVTPEYEDCYFRMLKPKEIKAGMAFPESYEITGTNKEQVKQSGNAVTPPALQLIGGRCIESLL